jgi:putative FmdB family regulatory protein
MRRRRLTLPLYEYKCRKCGHRFEKIESYSASTTKKCPKCGAVAERMLAAPAIQFKGSGWYVTDYAGKSSAKNAGESSEGATAEGAKKSDESKSSDSKSNESKSGESKSSESKSSDTKSTTGNEGSKKRKK